MVQANYSDQREAARPASPTGAVHAVSRRGVHASWLAFFVCWERSRGSSCCLRRSCRLPFGLLRGSTSWALPPHAQAAAHSAAVPRAAAAAAAPASIAGSAAPCHSR